MPAELEVIKRGPYAYVRHPNYVVVLGELLALPMSFSLNGLAAVATLANAVILALRIRDEEELLFQSPQYAEHFRSKPRFLPFF